jgi:hypothetical protein
MAFTCFVERQYDPVQVRLRKAVQKLQDELEEKYGGSLDK